MRLTFLCMAVVGLAACAAGSDATSGSGSSGDGGAGAGAGTSTSSSGGGSPASVATGTGGGSVIAEVYGHGPDDLYRLDPTTNTAELVASFSGCNNILDIAIDKDRRMFATSFDGLYEVDPDTAVCQLIAEGTYPNSLSFVPAGTLDPAAEALVGYDETDYIRIDPNSGNISVVNSGALTGDYVSSGDIVSVIGGGTYLTVKASPPVNGGCDDCIVEVDPTTGQVVNDFGSVGYSKVFGLAYWGGSAYGFSNNGELFEVQFGNGTVTSTLITISGIPPGFKFWGAGSTTSAPVVAID